jgi:hypothetical protein
VSLCDASSCDGDAEDRRDTLLRFLLEASQGGASRLLTPPAAIAESVVKSCISQGMNPDDFSTGDTAYDALSAYRLC